MDLCPNEVILLFIVSPNANNKVENNNKYGRIILKPSLEKYNNASAPMYPPIRLNAPSLISDFFSFLYSSLNAIAPNK